MEKATPGPVGPALLIVSQIEQDSSSPEAFQE
jgi:hypothetical protein